MIERVRQQILKSFKGLHFEPVNHVYTLKNKGLTPVSNVVKEFYKKFDTDGISQQSAERHGGEAKDYADAWALSGKIACDLGTRVHAFGEAYFYDRKLVPSDGYEKAVVAFWKSIPDHIIPLLAESRVFTENYQYAGTLDNLFWDTKRKGLIITDYKTNKDLHKNYNGQKMFPPFHNLLDTPFNRYQVQVSLYQIPFEDIGINVVDRRIIWLKPDGTHENMKTENYTKHLRFTLN